MRSIAQPGKSPISSSSIRRWRSATSINISPRPAWTVLRRAATTKPSPRSRMASPLMSKASSPELTGIADGHAISRHRPGRPASGPGRHPLVCPVLHRRADRRLALPTLAGGEIAGEIHSLADRRLPGLGDHRHRAGRTARLYPVLQAQLLSGRPAPDPAAVAWRHVVPWRGAGRHHRADPLLPPL